MITIELEDGKYTVTYEAGKLQALRYGEPWRDLTGDKMVAALVTEIERLREAQTQAPRPAVVPVAVVCGPTRRMRDDKGEYCLASIMYDAAYDLPEGTPLTGIPRPVIPQAVREGVEAAFEERPGWRQKIAAAARNLF